MLLLLWYMYVFILYSVGVLNSTSELTQFTQGIYLFIFYLFIYLFIFESCMCLLILFAWPVLKGSGISQCLENKLRLVWLCDTLNVVFHNFLEVPKTFYWNILNLKPVKYLSQGLKFAIPSKLPIFLILNLVIPIYCHKFPTIFISPSHLI